MSLNPTLGLRCRGLEAMSLALTGEGEERRGSLPWLGTQGLCT